MKTGFKNFIKLTTFLLIVLGILVYLNQVFLYRDEYYNENTEDKGIAECIVSKNRHGEVGTVKLQWIPQFQTFTDREWKHAE